MFQGKKILAVVPARSGSKGIADKNMQKIGDNSLIARAGMCLQSLPWIDHTIISTDSQSYAEEGIKHGLDAPFLRPETLSRDGSTAIDTMRYALQACEEYYQVVYDIFLLIEPTSPLRKPEDIECVVKHLIESDADSVVTVSTISNKYHPLKLLTADDGYLKHNIAEGEVITARQQLGGNYYIRNGVCYALTRQCLWDQQAIFSHNTQSYLIDRPLANIDDPIDLRWAEFLLGKN